jgi:hypothetical protein
MEVNGQVDTGRFAPGEEAPFCRWMSPRADIGRSEEQTIWPLPGIEPPEYLIVQPIA